MPVTDSTPTTPLEPVYAARMARVDGCPEACGNAEPPQSIAPTRDGFVASYVCAGCGHAWATSWKD